MPKKSSPVEYYSPPGSYMSQFNKYNDPNIINKYQAEIDERNRQSLLRAPKYIDQVQEEQPPQPPQLIQPSQEEDSAKSKKITVILKWLLAVILVIFVLYLIYKIIKNMIESKPEGDNTTGTGVISPLTPTETPQDAMILTPSTSDAEPTGESATVATTFVSGLNNVKQSMSNLVEKPLSLLNIKPVKLSKSDNVAEKYKYTVSIPDNMVPDAIMNEIADGGDSMYSISNAQSNETLPWTNGMFEGYDEGVPYMNVMGYGDQFITWSGGSPKGEAVRPIAGKKCCPRWTKNTCTSSPYGACGCPVKISVDDPKSTLIADSMNDVRN